MIDILQTAIDGDLLIQNGDFVFGESDTQNIYDIIYSNVGDWKQYLNVGVGIYKYLNGAVDNLNLKQKISAQLSGDGFNTYNLVVNYNISNSQEDINVYNVKR